MYISYVILKMGSSTMLIPTLFVIWTAITMGIFSLFQTAEHTQFSLPTVTEGPTT